ncbi:MAG: cellulase family glycosylhydrolase [Anaerolineales bacterium]
MFRRLCTTTVILLLITAPLGAVSALPGPREWLYRVTGEEELLPQLRGLVQWAFRWTRPLPQLAEEVPIAHTDLPPFGINTFLEQEVEPEKRERSLQMIADAGFRWIRQEFPWEDIEIHGKGDFEDRRHEPQRSAWEKYDQIVDLAEEYDLEIIARLSNPPSWSRAAGNEQGTYAPPDDFEDYADFVEAVATRYEGRIRFYQLWNEPNIYPEWGNRPVDPEAYTRLLCLAYERVKRVDPHAVVISGALAPTAELGTLRPDGGNNLMDTLFLQRMYDAGAGDCFDVMAVNDYMLFSGPTDRRLRPHLINFSRPLWVRDVMVANGDAHKPIWLTEMNSNALPEGLPTTFGRVTEEQQGRYAVQAFERVQRDWPWVGVVNVWFFKRADAREQEQPMYYFRLVEPDFTPLPVYHALQEYLTTLEPTLHAGYHAPHAWQVTYTGGWQRQNGEDPYAVALRGEAGDRLRLTWEGRQLRLHATPEESVVRLVRDGGEAEEIRVGASPTLLARHPLNGQHTLELTVLEGALAIEAFEIR